MKRAGRQKIPVKSSEATERRMVEEEEAAAIAMGEF